MSTRGVTLIMFAALVATAQSQGWVSYLQQASNNKLPPNKSTVIKSPAVPAISVHTVQTATVIDKLTLTGTVIPHNLIPVTPSLSGLRVVDMRVEAGDLVQRGQVLAVLDSSVLQAQLAQAEANLTQAQADIQQQEAAISQAQVLREAARLEATRYSRLFEAGAISQAQFGDRQVQALTANQQVNVVAATLRSALTTVDSKIAEIDRIKALLAQTLITAPATGTIAERFTSAGDTTNSGTPLYSLIENHQLALSLQPTQRQLAQMDIGTTIDIRTVESSQSEVEQTVSMRGSVYAIDPSLDPQSRRATVKVTLPEENSRLRAGMFLQATVIADRRRSIVVPAAAVMSQPDGTSAVFRLSEQSRAQNGPQNKKETRVKATVVSVAEKPAEIDADSTRTNGSGTTSFVEILSGLPAGSKIVAGDVGQLQDGELVEIAP